MKTVIPDMQKCCGCGACEQGCRFNSIKMIADKEGFLYPEIDEDMCKNCGKCARICPVNKMVAKNTPGEVYAAINLNDSILSDSSSGGVFTAISESVLESGGVVVGCVFDENFHAKQVFAESKKQLSSMRGSKYVQSNTEETYKKTKELLESGKLVLYTGTPCQIAGLKAFLTKNYENLLTADFVCHGVPSPELFIYHVTWLEKRVNKGKLTYFRFRTKNDPEHRNLYYFNYQFEKTKHVFCGSAALDPYYSAFLNAKTYRESCYQCKYASSKRVSDFTFADYWEAEKFHPELKDICGISVLLLNTSTAIEWRHRIERKMKLTSSKLNWIKAVNHNLSNPANRPEARDEIYSYINENGYDRWATQYCSTLKWKLMKIYGSLPVMVKKMLHK